MALRDWSARRIAFLWLAGVGFYGGLVLLGDVRRRERDARWRCSQAHRDSVLQHLTAVVRDTPLTTARSDSLSRALNIPARLSAAQKDSLQSSAESLLTPMVAPIAAGITKGMSGMGAWLVITAILFFAPALALLTLTIVWAYSRRRRAMDSDAAAA